MYGLQVIFGIKNINFIIPQFYSHLNTH